MFHSLGARDEGGVDDVRRRWPSIVWRRRVALGLLSVATACSGGGATNRSTGTGGAAGVTAGGGGANVEGTGGAPTPGAGGGSSLGTGGVTGSGGATTPVGGGGGLTGPAGATGGAPAGVPEANRVRTVIPFDGNWLFQIGDVAGADQPAFADTTWRALDVPHDWSIEGPFAMSAATTGRGGYLPSGIGWYRKHFTLPQSLAGHQIFIEFDGVMANSDVYVNGVHLGARPYGYVGFRYELTASAKLGAADNVLSVRCDNSLQPASRYYAGAGIYRHVRLLATDPVHVQQWATFVTTPAPSAATATVHVTTVVVNGGTSAASVAVQGIVTDPTGKAMAPVATPAQTVPPGNAGATFTLDIPVGSPRLWDVASPSMYTLLTNVRVGGVTVDDDVTPFGIRSLTFDAVAGMSLNGKSLKMKGVAIHQEMSGLGVAVPARAWQRRLAQFKALG